MVEEGILAEVGTMKKIIIILFLLMSCSAYATEVGTLKPSFVYNVISDGTQSVLSSNIGIITIDIPPQDSTIIIKEVKRNSWSSKITLIYRSWSLRK